MDYTYQMAELNPDIYFLHCSGYKVRENMSTYFGRMYQMRYLTGIVAGLRTESDKIGYLAAFPIPEVVRGANAFALGVKSVNPQATVKLSWSHTWYDPALEQALAFELIDSGCDVIAQHQDTVSPQVAAQMRGVWSIGYNSPMGFFAPDSYLTAAIWNWTPFMIDQVQKVVDGTWVSTEYWGGVEDDVVRLDGITTNAAPGTQTAVDNALNSIKTGFTIFEGPIYDNEGNLRIPAGSKMTDAEKLSFDWLVDNIEGVIER
jgi:basic membrane protein A